MMRGSKVLLIWPPVLALAPSGSPYGPGQVQVRVVQQVVELGAELHFKALDRCTEPLVERKVGLVRRACCGVGCAMRCRSGLCTTPPELVAGRAEGRRIDVLNKAARQLRIEKSASRRD